MASAPTSTSTSGAMSRRTSTMLVAGRISPKSSPCAFPADLALQWRSTPRNRTLGGKQDVCDDHSARPSFSR
jgi:hypothetical protein